MIDDGVTTDKTIERIRYETAYVALHSRAVRAEEALREAEEKHAAATKELLRQLSKLKEAVDGYNKMVEQCQALTAIVNEKDAALGAMYKRLEESGAL